MTQTLIATSRQDRREVCDLLPTQSAQAVHNPVSRCVPLSGVHRFDIELPAHELNELLDLEGFLQKSVRAGCH